MVRTLLQDLGNRTESHIWTEKANSEQD